MPDPTCRDDLAAKDNHRAVHSLAQRTTSPHSYSALASAGEVLAPLVATDHGLTPGPAQALRDVARLVSQPADTAPVPEQSPHRTAHSTPAGSSGCR